MGAPIDGCRDQWHQVQPGQTWSTATTIDPSDLAAENARLRQRAEKAEDERDRLQARLDTATAHVEELRGQRDEARAQLARALKVVQAANEWQLWDAQGALDTALYEWRAGLELSGPPLTAEELRRVVAQLPLSRQNTP